MLRIYKHILMQTKQVVCEFRSGLNFFGVCYFILVRPLLIPIKLNSILFKPLSYRLHLPSQLIDRIYILSNFCSFTTEYNMKSNLFLTLKCIKEYGLKIQIYSTWYCPPWMIMSCLSLRADIGATKLHKAFTTNWARVLFCIEFGAEVSISA